MRISLGAVAFGFGWQIGTGIHGKWLDGEAPAVNSGVFTSQEWALMPYTEGEEIQSFSVPYYLPSYPIVRGDLWYLARTSSNNPRLWYNPTVAGTCNQPRGNVSPGGEFEVFAEGAHAESCGYYNELGQRQYTDSAEIGWAYPESKLFPHAPVDVGQGQYPGVIDAPAPPDPGGANVLSDAATELGSNRYPTLNPWLSYALGEPGACDPISPSACRPSIDFPDREEHWVNHDHEFPVPHPDADDYWEDAADVVRKAEDGWTGFEKCIRPDADGDAKIYWDDDRGAIVVVKNGKITTFFIPTEGKQYFRDQDPSCGR